MMIILIFVDFESVGLGLMVDKVVLGQGFLPVLLFSLSVTFHQCSILVFIDMLPEGEKDEVWDAPKKQCSFASWELVHRKVFVLGFKA